LQVLLGALTARAFAEIRLAPILARQEPVCEPVEGNDPKPVRKRDVAQRAFELSALDQIVPGLKRARTH